MEDSRAAVRPQGTTRPSRLLPPFLLGFVRTCKFLEFVPQLQSGCKRWPGVQAEERNRRVHQGSARELLIRFPFRSRSAASPRG